MEMPHKGIRIKWPSKWQPFLLGILFLLLCVWDTVGTYHILAARLTTEGNPLMDSVIQEHGWRQVWLIKMGLAAIIIYSMPALWRSTWGKVLVIITFLFYSAVALIHMYILFFL